MHHILNSIINAVIIARPAENKANLKMTVPTSFSESGEFAWFARFSGVSDINLGFFLGGEMEIDAIKEEVIDRSYGEIRL